MFHVKMASRCLSQSTLTSLFRPLSSSFHTNQVKQSDNGKDFKGTPKDTLSQKEISQALEDAASFNERTGEGQVQWRSSSYHKDEVNYVARPPRPPRVKTPQFAPPSSSDDSQNSVLLFPGQGTQFVGMAKSLVEKFPTARDLFDSAGQILGYNLLKVCHDGPQKLLNQTKYCQPAVVVTSLCAVEALYSANPNAVKNCIATAGFSVGEITALIFSGALSFEDGIRLVGARAEAMDIASGMLESGMITIFYGGDVNLGLAMNAAKRWVEERHGIKKPVCQIANYLYEGAKAIGGHVECLKFIEENKNDFRIRKVKWLPVSGAFHTPLMLPAVEPFEEALCTARITDPRIPVYSNVDSKTIYRNAATIRKHLPRQIVQCVKWEQSMCQMFKYEKEEYFPNVFECGPGNSLSAMLHKINGKVGKKAVSVNL